MEIPSPRASACCGAHVENPGTRPRCQQCGKVPVGWNAEAEVERALHSQMILEGPRVWCPACDGGVVPVGSRNPDNEPIPDRCTMCGQGYWFVDLRGAR